LFVVVLFDCCRFTWICFGSFVCSRLPCWFLGWLFPFISLITLVTHVVVLRLRWLHVSVCCLHICPVCYVCYVVHDFPTFVYSFTFGFTGCSFAVYVLFVVRSVSSFVTVRCWFWFTFALFSVVHVVTVLLRFVVVVVRVWFTLPLFVVTFTLLVCFVVRSVRLFDFAFWFSPFVTHVTALFVRLRLRSDVRLVR
jgi:hypothetical protein